MHFVSLCIMLSERACCSAKASQRLLTPWSALLGAWGLGSPTMRTFVVGGRLLEAVPERRDLVLRVGGALAQQVALVVLRRRGQLLRLALRALQLPARVGTTSSTRAFVHHSLLSARAGRTDAPLHNIKSDRKALPKHWLYAPPKAMLTMVLRCLPAQHLCTSSCIMVNLVNVNMVASTLVEQRVLAHAPQLHVLRRQRLRLPQRVRDARLRRRKSTQDQTTALCDSGVSLFHPDTTSHREWALAARAGSP